MQDDPRGSADDADAQPGQDPVAAGDGGHPESGVDAALTGDAPTEVIPTADPGMEPTLAIPTADPGNEPTLAIPTADPGIDPTLAIPTADPGNEPTSAIPDTDVTGTREGTVDSPVVTSSEPSTDEAETEGEEPSDDSPRPRRRGLWITLGIVGAVVLAVAGYLIWDAVTRAMREESITSTVTTYLQSTADGDAEAALATLSEPPADTSLITNEVLAVSQSAAPLTNPEVTSVTVDGETATAGVSYTLGSEDVRVTLSLVGDGRTSWHITDGLTDLTVSSADALTINGASVDAATHPVLPGSYTMEPTSDLIALSGETSALITDPLEQAVTLAPEYGLSEQGTEGVKAAVTDQFDACLASTESSMDNCPFGVDASGVEVEAGSVRYTLNNDPFKQFAPQLDPAAMTATGTISFDITASAKVTFDGRTGEPRVPVTGERSWVVDLTQSPLSATWS